MANVAEKTFWFLLLNGKFGIQNLLNRSLLARQFPRTIKLKFCQKWLATKMTSYICIVS